MITLKPIVLLNLFMLIQADTLNQINLGPPEASYKILFLIPFGLSSHRNAMIPIARALAQRNHQVVILSGLPPANIHTNVTEIRHPLLANSTVVDFFTRRKNPVSTFTGFSQILPKIAREIYDVPEVKKLFEERNSFDLIVIDEFFNEFAYPFLHGQTFIFISPIGLTTARGAVMRNFLHPSYYPGLNFDKIPPFTFWERILNFLDHLHFPLNWRHVHVVPKVQEEICKRFPDLPPLLELERNASLVLVQTHFTFGPPTPLLPSQIEIAGHICTSPQPLPSDIENWIEGSPFGVVYFSLGSVVQAHRMPKEYFETFIEAFRRLRQRVIWKYEENIPHLPRNVLTRKWLPQQDIISNPKVKLFITHGGLHSTIESTCHGIPLLVVPILGDQLKNANYITSNGFGESLIWEDLTPEILVETINKIVSNQSYSDAMKKASKYFLDQPETPLQRAVWWTEYVIRHKGAPGLRSPATDLSIIEYFLVDVFAFLLLIFFVFIYLLKFTCRCICELFSMFFKGLRNSSKIKEN